MIHEYAVDPGLLRDWQTFRHLADGFGFSHGRIIARYPKHWKKLAYQAAEGLDDDNVKKRTVTWLAERADKAMSQPRLNATPFTRPEWFDNAVVEHQRLPFQAIIANRPASANPPVLNSSDVDDYQVLWKVGRQRSTGRNHAEISQHVAPLLEHAAQIRFIDPYFMADPDQVRILIGCLSRCARNGATNVTSIELHVDGVKVKPATEQLIVQRLGAEWQPGLPALKVIRWRAEYLHNRFILTDNGGIKFGDSFREHPTRPDELMLLEEDIHAEVWQRHDHLRNPQHIVPPGTQA